MTTPDVVHGLAQAAAVLVEDYDLASALVQVVAASRDAVGADAVGLIVRNGRDELELLTATSHRAADLETYQAASGEGPCVDCMTQKVSIRATGADVSAQWPGLAALMRTAGYDMVLATPLHWRGQAIGGLNLFWRVAGPLGEDRVMVSQAFADALTLTILNARPVAAEVTSELLDAALRGRVVIEQAKGVLAQLDGLSMEEAFERLLERAQAQEVPLSDVARAVVDQASRRDSTERAQPQ
jgi:hypothetical protein